MTVRLFLLALVPFVASSCAAPRARGGDPIARPRLVLQITVDQLRADLPLRYYERLGPGGFRYLYEHGVVYTNAHHAHANTETIVGHATLATGADVDRKTEIDPTQRAARSEGRSPRAILVPTFSDELVRFSAGRSKAFGVSIKDRGAVSMAGHAGKAFWFSKARGEFVTSSYYYDRYPEWVEHWNAERKPLRYAAKSWQLLHPRQTYTFGEADDRPWETDLAGFGRAFPHPFGARDGKYFPTLLTISPAGDELTLDFAKALVEAEQLARGPDTDNLSISFLSTDYVGHVFGPSSLEAEDNILRLDRLLAELLDFIDRRVGLANTVIVLSADHGAPDAPGILKQLGIPAGYVNPDAWDSDDAITRVKQRFGIQGKLIQRYSHPYVYLAPEIKQDGSPWGYDTHVPIVFVVPGVAGRRIARTVHTVDVAPTLAGVLGISTPAGASGEMLTEVVR